MLNVLSSDKLIISTDTIWTNKRLYGGSTTQGCRSDERRISEHQNVTARPHVWIKYLLVNQQNGTTYVGGIVSRVGIYHRGSSSVSRTVFHCDSRPATSSFFFGFQLFAIERQWPYPNRASDGSSRKCRCSPGKRNMRYSKTALSSNLRSCPVPQGCGPSQTSKPIHA